MDGYDKLAFAIVEQAAIDYQEALCKRDKLIKDLITTERMISDCERFFDGQTFKIYSKLNGSWLKDELHKECEEYKYNYKKVVEAHGKSSKEDE